MNKAELIGSLLVITGILVLAGYGLFLFAQSAEIPLLIRLGIVALFTGFLIVLLSLVRERIIDVQKEKGNVRR
jgi:hypothetical protein